MLSKHIRIELDGNKAYLVYRRGMIQEYAAIKPQAVGVYGSNRIANQPLAKALKTLRQYIQFERLIVQRADKLEQRRRDHFLTLLKQKRRQAARECLKQKKPMTLHKYIGVEMEFVSSSDQESIAESLALAGLTPYVELKYDGSVGRECDECQGDCREDCNCADCGETHYCDDETECNRRARYYGGDGWQFNEGCSECDDAGCHEEIDGCDCGGYEQVDGEDDKDSPICEGRHVYCVGHCPGHGCMGSDDHEDYECSCECTCSGGDGHEIAVIAKAKDMPDVLRRVCKVLQDHDAEVNDTCGLHIHLDARNQDEKRMFANLVKAQRLLYSMVPAKRKKSYYCKPNTSLEMNKHHTRYHGINPESFDKYQTIEVRLHSGSVNAEKVIKWIELLRKIAYAKKTKEINKLSDLTGRIKMSTDLVEYVKDRVTKFAKEHGSYSIDLEQVTPVIEQAPMAA